MYNIPYQFDTPIPTHFRKIGWMNNPKTACFISWAFSACGLSTKTEYVGFKEVVLLPFEFIFSRSIASRETGLTDQEVRTQIERLEAQYYIAKTSKSVPNLFTVYRWSPRLFEKQDNQVKTEEKPIEQPKKQQDNNLPVTIKFLERKKEKYSQDEVQAACDLYTERFITGKLPKPVSAKDWFNDCLRRKYWEEKKKC